MLRYEGMLGDIEVQLTLDDEGQRTKGHIIFYGQKDDTGMRTGWGSKVTRRELIEFADLLKRIV